MAKNKFNLPSGQGGLLSFKEEYKSKFNLSPMHVIIFILLIIILRAALPLFLK